MSEDPAGGAGAPASSQAGSELKPYRVFEATGEKNEDLSFRIEVKAKDRDHALDLAGEKEPSLKRRFDDGQELELLALAKAHATPQKVGYEVRRVRKGASS